MPVYHTANLDKVSHEDIQLRINDQLFFETLLMEIRGKTILCSSFKKKQDTFTGAEFTKRNTSTIV